MCAKAGRLISLTTYDSYKSHDIPILDVSKGFIAFPLQIFNKVVSEPAVSIDCRASDLIEKNAQCFAGVQSTMPVAR